MAEVMSPLIPQNDPISMLQSRPSSSEAFQSTMSSSQQHQPRTIQMPRSQYSSHSASSAGYRGTSAAPVAPYAFKSTPQLRQEIRASSAPTLPSGQPLVPGGSNRQRYPAPDSVSTTSSATSSDPSGGAHHPFSKDDALLFTNFQVPSYMTEPGSVADIHVASAGHGQTTFQESPSKPSPDRYRRGHRRNDSSQGSVGSQQASPFDTITGTTGLSTAKVGQIFHNPQQVAVAHQRPLGGDFRINSNGPVYTENSSNGETMSNKGDKSPIHSPGSEIPKRYRRRSSFGNMEAGAKVAPGSPSVTTQVVPSPVSLVQNPVTQDMRPTSSAGPTYRPTSSSSNARSFTSADAVRRINNPSPLSKPVTAAEAPAQPGFGSTSPVSKSPAVAAMAALNDRDASKGVKSRLRRAFSFGSSAELRRATGEVDPAADRARARREQFSSELDEEQDAIAQRQEATGLGRGIYSTQSNNFTGSTDNLSISSTASSASLMLRKMGKGMRKGGRSLKGLFRPKSVVGVPSADATLQASVGPVSLVTVEAEREQVNVNANPHDHVGGGTGFPRLERNSIDAVARTSTSSQVEGQTSESRDTIDGEQEHVEVLAAVRRGILKRAATTSPVTTPIPFQADGAFDRNRSVFGSSAERRPSPAPSTSSSEPRRTGHRRTDSSTIESDDYFASIATRYTPGQSSRSLPGTPRGMARNISFSPRIQFHDVWSSSEYDRRGDVATCNRLTPMLAQQIKEELNNFKMEMEVHELSKTHTHFF